MNIDFGKLGTGNPADEVLEPRKIFTSLANKDRRYTYPRDVQTQVMEKWFARRDDRDVVIKMNTGSGKTVVGLLLLKSCMNEKKGPAVYVTPDKYLTQQVLAEAAALTIPAVEDERDPRFVSSKAILVINIDKLVNGKSTFGVSGEGIKIPIGSIVIDDAHSCIARTREKFSLRLTSDHPAYEPLLALFRDELERQSQHGILDVEQQDQNTVLAVPFWAWKDKQKDVVSILHTHRSDDSCKFVWPLLVDVLPLCQCAFGGGQLEIAPRCSPTDVINSFHSAKRRIYMTATLADDSILVTDFDASPELVKSVIAPIAPTISATAWF
jgi:hypothetical protein